MTNIRPLMKRVGAYAIDLFIIIMISTLISYTPLFNSYKESYRKTYSEYTIKYTEYANYLDLFNKSYSDKEITEEEYIELADNSKYSEIVVTKYEDNKITENESEEITNKLTEISNEEAKEYVYLLNKKGTYNSIITLVCTLLYFGVLQYFLNGQTIGKKLLKLQVVSVSNKKVNIFIYILRSLIVNDVLLNTISIILLITLSKATYTSANNVISTIISLVEASIIFLVIYREDQRGLHDLIFNTKVISTTKEQEEPVEKIESKTKSKPKSKKKVIEYKEGEK